MCLNRHHLLSMINVIKVIMYCYVQFAFISSDTVNDLCLTNL